MIKAWVLVMLAACVETSTGKVTTTQAPWAMGEPGRLPATDAPGAAVTPQSRCEPVTEMAPLDTAIGRLPDGVSDDDGFNAAMQFEVSAGGTIDTQDRATHTFRTRPFTGQTLTSTCESNKYYVLATRVVIRNGTIVVGMDCWSSWGWEAQRVNGVYMPANRGELAQCMAPLYVSKGDSKIPQMVIDGTRSLIELTRH